MQPYYNFGDSTVIRCEIEVNVLYLAGFPIFIHNELNTVKKT